MSIIICKHCGAKVDTDFNSEHEDECEYNENNKYMPNTETTKEKLIEKFDKIVNEYKNPEFDFESYNNLIDFTVKAFKNARHLLGKAIDQTREETIKEVEEMLEEITPAYDGEALNTNNNRRYYEQGFGEYKEEIKQSLKSLINK